MEQWYSNKQLFEMLQDLSKDIEQLRQEITRTTTLLRDYNGLREKINDMEEDIAKIKTEIGVREKTSSNIWGYVIGIFGLFMALLSYLKG